MSKRQFLEKMIEDLIENNQESARANFHQFVVESAREIHASLIETDELEDDLDDADGEKVEESFEVVSEDDGEGDIGGEIPATGDDGFGGDDTDGGEGEEIDPDHDGDNDEAGDHVEVSIEDYDDLKAQLAALQAKFDALNPEGEEAGEEGEGEEVEAPFQEMGHEDHDGLEDGEMEEGIDLTEDDLLGLEECWTEVKVSMDGHEQGDGKFAGGEKNTKTPIAHKEEKDVEAKDLVSKQDAHKGYEREKAPVPPVKSDSRNVSPSGKKSWSEVTAKMDGQEQGGGKFATPEKSKTTPVAKN